MANILVGMLRGLIIQSLLEGDAARLAANRAQIHAFIDTGLRKQGGARGDPRFPSRRKRLPDGATCAENKRPPEGGAWEAPMLGNSERGEKKADDNSLCPLRTGMCCET